MEGSGRETIRQLQRKTVIQALRLEEKRGEIEEVSLTSNWKVLIFDDSCSDILAQLVHREDLREYGVTLFLPLKNSRQKIEDAPAVYFVAPTEENINILAKDVEKGIYSSYYFHFCTKISDHLLKSLALKCSKSPNAQNIQRVCDEYINFVSFGENLISLNNQKSYATLNDNTLSQEVLTEYLNEIVDGLVCVLVSWGRVPVIRAPRNSLAAEIANRLNAKLQEYLRQPNNPFYVPSSSSAPSHRPVLVLLDRSIDLSVMLRHSFTYQPLLHDLLNFNKNRVTCEVVEEKENKQEREKKVYDLEATDSFWNKNTSSSFPEVAQHIQDELAEYQKAKEKVAGLKLTGDGQEFDPDALLGKTQDLGAFMSRMPELTKTKKLLDMHTNIATALLREINARDVLTYYEVEHSVVTEPPSSPLIERIMKTLRGSPEQPGTLIDKLRLFLIYYVSHAQVGKEVEDIERFIRNFIDPSDDPSPTPSPSPSPSPSSSSSFFQSFSPSSSSSSSTSEEEEQPQEITPASLPERIDMSACFNHFKKKKTFGIPSSEMKTAFSSDPSSSAMGNRLSKLTAFGTDLWGTGFRQIASGISGYVSSSQENFRVTSLVSSLMTGEQNKETDSFLHLDPRSSRSSSSSLSSSSSSSSWRVFRDGFVFMIGGGNYLELENIQNYAKQAGKNIIYGTTEILSPEEFLVQASDVGKKAK